MIGKFIKTTLYLWLKVPDRPPLWKCATVAAVMMSGPEPNKMGSVVIEELVESEIED